MCKNSTLLTFCIIEFDFFFSVMPTLRSYFVIFASHFSMIFISSFRYVKPVENSKCIPTVFYSYSFSVSFECRMDQKSP